MIFSDESGICIPGEFDARLQDNIHIATDGARWFTPQSASIEKPFDQARRRCSCDRP